jgi:hypothetical protein
MTRTLLICAAVLVLGAGLAKASMTVPSVCLAYTPEP